MDCGYLPWILGSPVEARISVQQKVGCGGGGGVVSESLHEPAAPGRWSGSTWRDYANGLRRPDAEHRGVGAVVASEHLEESSDEFMKLATVPAVRRSATAWNNDTCFRADCPHEWHEGRLPTCVENATAIAEARKGRPGFWA